jgi:cell growth-regulating nucleolar protein
LLDNEHSKEPKLQDPPKADTKHYNSEADKGTSPSKKKRKLDASVNGSSKKKTKDDTSGDLGNGEVIHGDLCSDKMAEPRSNKEQTKKKIKWKKLITSALKSVCIFNNNLFIFPFQCNKSFPSWSCIFLPIPHRV